ncbi:MAG: ribonuclease G [Gammaproteobacteria bacterium]|nr:ribonuclease G [Gammaproteobacteria bacterium]MDE2250505.1 ribonuclease G [Gammaproteobacteria bacterium]
MREILLNVTPRETRAALIENGSAQELYIERASRRGLVGNLYKGRVSRVLPGMQAAFIDIGLERTAFLHAADIARAVPAEAENGAPPVADIGELVQPGQDILVQVLKDPLGSKGARLSTFVSLASRFLVYMPVGRGVGVSARIGDETERERLRTLMRELVEAQPDEVRRPDARPVGGGYIVRTAARAAPLEALRADMLYLARLWEHVRQEQLRATAGSLVHADLPLGARMLRDELGADVRRVLVDEAAEYERLRAFAAAFMPEAVGRIERYAGARPLFELHGIEAEITRALERQVQLQSGGYIVFDQTESMTTIDVNTGGYVGNRSPEETVYRTNLEATVAIARQLRLRNLGGIIIIDFIDMEDAAHRAQLLAAFQAALAGDRAQNQVAEGAPLGLVAMTRKRTRESLEHLLCEPCQTCQGRGFVRSVETTCHEIYREALRQGAQLQVRELVILAHPEVVERLLDEEAPVLAELELRVGKPIRLQSEALYSVEQYDIVLA